MKNKALFNTFFLVAFTVTLYISFLVNVLIIVRILDPGYITVGYFFVAVVTVAYILYALLAKPVKKLLKLAPAGRKDKPDGRFRITLSRLYIVTLFGWFASVLWASSVK